MIRFAKRHDIPEMALLAFRNRESFGGLMTAEDLNRMLREEASLLIVAETHKLVEFSVMKISHHPDLRIWSSFTAAEPGTSSEIKRQVREFQVKIAKELGFDKIWGHVLHSNPAALARRIKSGWTVEQEGSRASLISLEVAT